MEFQYIHEFYLCFFTVDLFVCYWWPFMFPHHRVKCFLCTAMMQSLFGKLKIAGIRIPVIEFVNIMATFKFNYIESQVKDKQPIKKCFLSLCNDV